MSDLNEATPQVAPDRKALLLEQFTAEEAAPRAEGEIDPAPAPVEGRARDEKGKFVAKEAAPVATPEATPAPEAAPAPAEPPPWTAPPKSWKKDYAEGWGTLPDNFRQYIHDREQQMKAGVEPLLPKAELADKINKAAEPYMNTIRGLGIGLDQAVSGLMAADHQLRTLPYEQKLNYAVGLLRQYGIDLTGQAANAAPAMSPDIQALQNELLGIKGQFSSFMQSQEQRAEQEAMKEIQKFSAKAEHFEDAKPTMIQLLQSGMADSIEDAYDKAIRLNPDLFERVNAAKQASTEAEKRKAADMAAKAAKAAAVSVKSATPGTSKPNVAQDRRSMLQEQLAGIEGRL